MTKPSFAATRLINPPGVTPVLTHEQVWKGLGIKAREPKTFVPVITSCELVKDEDNKLLRAVSFNGAPVVHEAVESYGNTIVYFEVETGIRITNIISYNEDGELCLTFSFANGLPGYPEGAEIPVGKELNKRMGQGIEHSIKRLRELAVEGKI